MFAMSFAPTTGRRLVLRPFSSLVRLSTGSSESLCARVAPVQGCDQALSATRSPNTPQSKFCSVRYMSNDAQKSPPSLNKQTPYNLCFVRHGQSTWNRDNRFIGWTDTPLTEEGILEARVAGQVLAESNIKFDEVHTSLLRRSIRTVNLVLMEIGQEYIPVHKHYRLNERNYGDLVGKNKKEIVRQHGKDQVKRWRRSYDEPPPPMSPDHPYWPGHDPRYHHMLDKIPLSESLHCTLQRSSVYWDEVIVPAMKSGKTVLVVGHENNLRSLLMHLEGIPKEDIIHLNLPRAVPLAYKVDLETMKPINMRTNGQLDEATGFLSGDWLGGDNAVSRILDRDEKQVYDITVEQNLEIGSSDALERAQQSKNDRAWRAWMGSTTSSSGKFGDMGFGSSANVGVCDFDVTQGSDMDSSKRQRAA